MDVDNVETRGGEHPAQAGYPQGIPRRSRVEAPDRLTPQRLQGACQGGFLGEQVCDPGGDAIRVAQSGMLHEELLGAAGAQSLDDPQDRKRPFDCVERAMGGDHAR
jgi:hypothetical protein